MLKEIKIMGIPFKIVEKSVVCKGENGLTRGAIDFSNDMIEINEEMPPERKEQVLIHEILHAIFDLIGDDELAKDEKNSAKLICRLTLCYQRKQTIYILDLIQKDMKKELANKG